MNELREYVKRKFNISDSDYKQLVEKEKKRISNPTYNYDGLSLDEAKALKAKELSHACKQDIVYGFTASNGNRYRLTVEDQLNMQGQKSELDATTIAEVDWMTADDKTVTHTRDEWYLVYDEAFQHKNDAIWRNKQLRDQVLAATTIEEVKAVAW